MEKQRFYSICIIDNMVVKTVSYSASGMEKDGVWGVAGMVWASEDATWVMLQ